ncbi:MAG TPA: lysozyme [Victivallales bacterium]|nr:lysozyme [Victivallales bacterium]
MASNNLTSGNNTIQRGTYANQKKYPSELHASAELREYLKSIEKLVLYPYDDQTQEEIHSWIEGATIGYGHLISKQEWSKYNHRITEQQANLLFLKDLTYKGEKIVQKYIKVKLTQYQFDALVSLVFNIGIGNFSDSSIKKLINNPNAMTNYSNLESAWKAWQKSQGRINNGLINRRKSEWILYSTGRFTRW